MLSSVRVVIAGFVLAATLGAAAPAQAWEVHVSITGAGQVTETTPADLVGSGCVTSAANPTGTVGVDCYPGDPGGDYGSGWTVRYVATAKPGYHFVQWQSDGSPNPVICDSAGGSSTYTGSACQFATWSNLQTRAVFVDDTAPTMSSLSGPNNPVNGPTAFSFSATADPTLNHFECRVVNVHDWVTCTSGRQENPPNGDYTFDVRAVDASGNTSSVSSWGWTVDKVTPETSLASSGPSGTVSSTTASFEFTSNESGDFVCTLDTVTVTCGSPKSYTGLSNESHTFSVAARDVAGNVDPSPATRTWTVDTIAPETTLDPAFGPSGTTTSTSAEFRFSSSEGNSTFLCQLDSAAAAPCASPQMLSGLGVGTHTFRVVARDAAGNTDASEASRTWTVAAPEPQPDAGSTTSSNTTNTTNTTNTSNTGDTSTAVTNTPAPVASPAAQSAITGPASGSGRAAKSGAFTVPGQLVSCPAGCKVSVNVTGTAPTGASKSKRMVFATKSFVVLGTSGLQLKLTRKGLAALKRLGKARLTVAIKVVPAGSATAITKTVKLTLRSPKR